MPDQKHHEHTGDCRCIKIESKEGQPVHEMKEADTDGLPEVRYYNQDDPE